MIVNHRYRFIFLKTKKTAGTSIEIALSRYCDGNDILSKIGHRDEPKRAALGYQGPANHLEPVGTSLRERIRGWFHAPKARYWNHMPARELREKIGEETWNSYFKFCFERNPWDRAISAYHWENRSKSKLPDFYAVPRESSSAATCSRTSTPMPSTARSPWTACTCTRTSRRASTTSRGGSGCPGRSSCPMRSAACGGTSGRTARCTPTRERDFVAKACEREIREFGYRF